MSWLVAAGLWRSRSIDPQPAVVGTLFLCHDLALGSRGGVARPCSRVYGLSKGPCSGTCCSLGDFLATQRQMSGQFLYLQVAVLLLYPSLLVMESATRCGGRRSRPKGPSHGKCDGPKTNICAPGPYHGKSGIKMVLPFR